MKPDERALAQDILGFTCDLLPGGAALKIPAKFLFARFLARSSHPVEEHIKEISKRILFSLKQYNHEFTLTDPARLPLVVEAFRFSLKEVDLSVERLVSEFALDPEPLCQALLAIKQDPLESLQRDTLRQHISREFSIQFMEIVPKLPGFDIVWCRHILCALKSQHHP